MVFFKTQNTFIWSLTYALGQKMYAFSNSLPFVLSLMHILLHYINMKDIAKISTESYKGVRDFYPEDLFIQNYIFNVWRSVAESFGYVEYNASILESAELYKAKSGEEIVNEQ